MIKELISLYKDESVSVTRNLNEEELFNFIKTILWAYKNESTIFACGNGGNVAYVENLVVDLNMHPFVP